MREQQADRKWQPWITILFGVLAGIVILAIVVGTMLWLFTRGLN